jgi:2,3-bisphosphoglycerate-independent phosphoglycerate mutase
MEKKAILVILDGWGEGDGSKADVIQQSKTPFFDIIKKTIPHSSLEASGEKVGLPKGQMGNSEVGHLNIGAGRIVYQDLLRINEAIEDKSIDKNAVINNAFEYVKKNNKKLHFLGLVSDGGVHSTIEHLKKLIKMTSEAGVKNAFIHALTDGRDTDPYSGKDFISDLEEFLETQTTEIASVCGRYYTMDRDTRWERIKEGYDLLVSGKGKKVKTATEAIKTSYENNITDEFIKPSVIVRNDGSPKAIVENGDVVFCFNFRSDRLREITTVLSQENMFEHDMKTIPLHYITLTSYDENFKNVHLAFENHILKDTIGEVLSKNKKTQLRIAETEKYAHVTFFFSGGREKPFENEERILISSPKIATYDLKPSMSAFEVKDAVVEEIRKEKHDFICLNFANADMVGHTGIYKAITEAIETIDKCTEEVVNAAKEHDYSVIIIADHGNADNAINKDGSPNTAHSLNPVPCFIFDKDFKHVEKGKLCDVAPTILKIMGIPIPDLMNGKVLIS